eukprot:CAMPEP_0204601548 /NCGR_PEP_ID=MMETSP0661-20131031/56099_1 /ASSEMBLY_ACC=CAM_ASM_000606 /TAXON_ID=109239 /ORGANISM="Alexandrium margalefi, Strain AMGDE01CS-322" /LENGTH=376 /DNA_ID=CAMNT_0051612431 /DNA_START=93 /DNA_END=1223 /DNA_ORIENTATION=-
MARSSAAHAALSLALVALLLQGANTARASIREEDIEAGSDMDPNDNAFIQRRTNASTDGEHASGEDEVSPDGPLTKMFRINWPRKEYKCLVQKGQPLPDDCIEKTTDGKLRLRYYLLASRAPKRAVVFLHGGGGSNTPYGTKFHREWRLKKVPYVSYYFLRPPDARQKPGNGDSYTWPSYLNKKSPSKQTKGCNKFGRKCSVGPMPWTESCADVLNCRYEDESIENNVAYITMFLEWIGKSTGVGLENVILGGFSQGAQTTVHMATTAIGPKLGGFFVSAVNPFPVTMKQTGVKVKNLVMFHSLGDHHFPLAHSLQRMRHIFKQPFTSGKDLIVVGDDTYPGHQHMGGRRAIVGLGCYLASERFDCYIKAAEKWPR